MKKCLLSLLVVLLMIEGQLYGQTETYRVTFTQLYEGGKTCERTVTLPYTFTSGGGGFSGELQDIIREVTDIDQNQKIFLISNSYFYLTGGEGKATAIAEPDYSLTINRSFPGKAILTFFAYRQNEYDPDFLMRKENVLAFQLAITCTPVNNSHSISLAEGTEDASAWTIAPSTGEKGTQATVSYSGPHKVKRLKASRAWDGDLSKLSSDVSAEFPVATDGMTISGTLASDVLVSIVDGATVTLHDATIGATGDENFKWARIACEGDATIILSGENTVRGFQERYPAIHVLKGHTLTIKGEGSLVASGRNDCTAIGGGNGVGAGSIIIDGGTVTAIGGEGAPAIGSLEHKQYERVVVTDQVIRLTAIKGAGSEVTIGSCEGSEERVTIGGVEYPEGIRESPFIYPSSNE